MVGTGRSRTCRACTGCRSTLCANGQAPKQATGSPPHPPHTFVDEEPTGPALEDRPCVWQRKQAADAARVHQAGSGACADVRLRHSAGMRQRDASRHDICTDDMHTAGCRWSLRTGAGQEAGGAAQHVIALNTTNHLLCFVTHAPPVLRSPPRLHPHPHARAGRHKRCASRPCTVHSTAHTAHSTARTGCCSSCRNSQVRIVLRFVQ